MKTGIITAVCLKVCIFLGIARGRFGNQLQIYMVLQQLEIQLGMKAFINKQCKEYMETYFEKDSVTIPAISDEYCNSKEIIEQLEPFDEHFDDLVNHKEWRKGKMIEFYPPPEPKSKDFWIKRHRFIISG